jgi:hypothetical protein
MLHESNHQLESISSCLFSAFPERASTKSEYGDGTQSKHSEPLSEREFLEELRALDSDQYV